MIADYRGQLLAIAVGLFAAGSLESACSSSKSVPPSAPPQATALLGDIRPVVSIKELMRDLIDPASDYIFDSVSTVIGPQGTVERVPRTDEDWEKVRVGAVTLAEGVSLLKVRRPVAPSGEEGASSDPDATELTADQITARLAADPVEWNARIEALRNVGLEVLDLVKRKDSTELLEASENLDAACENCHRSYWYPRENTAFYQQLDRRLREAAGSSRK
jgi:hypothetical protein